VAYFHGLSHRVRLVFDFELATGDVSDAPLSREAGKQRAGEAARRYRSTVRVQLQSRIDRVRDGLPRGSHRLPSAGESYRNAVADIAKSPDEADRERELTRSGD
jgi:hypothetical protein